MDHNLLMGTIRNGNNILSSKKNTPTRHHIPIHNISNNDTIHNNQNKNKKEGFRGQATAQTQEEGWCAG